MGAKERIVYLQYNGEPVFDFAANTFEVDKEGYPLRIHDIGATQDFAGKHDRKLLTDLKKKQSHISEPSGKITRSNYTGKLFEIPDVRDTKFAQTLISWAAYFKRNNNKQKALVTTSEHVFEVSKQYIENMPKNVIGTRIGNQWAVHTDFLKANKKFYLKNQQQELDYMMANQPVN